MKIKPRLSIRLTLLIIALIGGLFAFIRWNDPAVRYRRDHDEASLDVIMSQRVALGDTVERIERMLGAGKPINDPRFRRSVASFVAQAPARYPEGLKPDDEFRGYASGEGKQNVLQFRGGRLINFKPADYVGPSAGFTGAVK